MAETEQSDLVAENEALRKRVDELSEENLQLREEKVRLNEEVELLQNRLNKLSRAVGNAQAQDAEAEGRLPPMLQQMLRHQKDEVVQLKGIEALFAQQAQIDGASSVGSGSIAQASLEATCAVYANFPANRTLLLKASQLMSVLLSEADAQQSLSLATVLQASEQVVASSARLLTSIIAGVEAEPAEGSRTPPATKLLTWLLALLEKTLPLLGPLLRDSAKAEGFVERFLSGVITPVLSSEELLKDAVGLKCIQLLMKLPIEPWLQKVCLDSGLGDALAKAFHQCAREGCDTALPKALRAGLRGIFAENLELCIAGIQEKFVSDEYVCVLVLDELLALDKKQRGTLRKADVDFGLLGKALALWAHHEAKATQSSQQEAGPATAREVLGKVGDVISATLLKLPPQVLLQRMQEFESREVLQRLALVAIHSNSQLRLQVAVGYVDNGAVPALIRATQMFLHEASVGQEVAFRLLRNDQLPPERWPYISYCLECFKHILSHWSATRLSAPNGQGGSALDDRAAPLLLAQGGLVDVLAELIEPGLAGENAAQPPASLQGKASETLQALFEQNGHICLFCMQHYAEVKQMVSLGCESLALNPLTEFPDLQQQAVEHLAASYERHSAGDQRLSRRVLKALSILFESSYRLCAWFLRTNSLTTLPEYHSLDVHIVAVSAVTRTPYWSYEDVAILPEFVCVIAHLVLGSLEGLLDQPLAVTLSSSKQRRRKPLELGEAEEVVAASAAALLHLLLIDPSPPTVLRNLSRSLAGEEVTEADLAADDDRLDDNPNSEKAVTVVMQIMQVFPSSDRLQRSCQHLLTSLLGE